MPMSTAKKQHFIMQYVPSLSDEDNSSELTKTIPSATSLSDDDVRQLKIIKL